jgi:hypothetical protein
MRSISLYITTLFAFTLTSITTHAQEITPPSETEIAPPPTAASEPSDDLTAPEASVAEAAPFRARVELSQTLGITGGGGFASTGQTAIGYVISDHFVWQAGGGASLTQNRYGEGTTYDNRSWTAFTGFEIYTRAPRAGGFSPTFRFSVDYTGSNARSQAGEDSGLSGNSTYKYHTLGGRASGGVTYFATDHVGIAFDVGLQASRVLNELSSPSYGNDSRFRTFATSMGLAVLLRY